MKDYKEDIHYSDEVRNAVRYGYLYRKKVEKDGNGNCHACLGDSPEVLLWIANAVLGGVVYDVIKSGVKKLYQRIIDGKKQIDKPTEAILTDESELEVFCTYVMEFHEHRITANRKQIKYIREEIIADYVGNEVSSIFEKEKRTPTLEENKVIIRRALMLADELINIFE